MSKNTNCLEGIRCPECGYEDGFYINVTMTAVNVFITDNGYDIYEAEHTDDEWGDEIRCEKCDHKGTLNEFRVEEDN